MRRGYVEAWGPSAERHITKTWGDPLKWNKEAEERGSRSSVFAFSLGDVFEDRAELNEHRARLWKMIKSTTHLDWMVLTKRPENIAKMLPDDWGNGYENVALFVSTENQVTFDERVAILRATPARYRGLSCEPLIGPIRMEPGSLDGIDMIIVGGESSPKARPMNPAWARHIRDACARDGVKFFFKQWGNWSPDPEHRLDDLSNVAAFTAFDAEPVRLDMLPTVNQRHTAVKSLPGDFVAFASSKKATGRLLDGQEHLEHIFERDKAKQPVAPDAPPPSPSNDSPALTESESSDLANLEAIVAGGVEAFWRVGEALGEIRDRRLYRATHSTFENYVAEKWGMQRSESYRQIDAARVIQDLAVDSGAPLPSNASVARPLAKIKDPEVLRMAWSKATSVAQESGQPVTAALVAEVVETSCAPSASPSTRGRDPKPERRVQAGLLAVAAALEKAIGDGLTPEVRRLLGELKSLSKKVKM